MISRLFGSSSSRRSNTSSSSSNQTAELQPSSSTSSRNSIPTSLPSLLPEDHSSSGGGCCNNTTTTSKQETTQLTMKQKVLQIQGNKSLTPREKAVSMQNLMMQRWNDAQQEKSEPSSPAGSVGSTATCPMDVENLPDPQKVVTYHDEENGILGCAHYARSCKFLSKCCNKWYTCRFCHDEAEDHPYDRYTTETISCMKCHTIQDLAEKCKNCNESFARYFCDVCRFYDDSPDKDIYHCDKCKICRIGKGLGIDYFHCDKCNACMSVTLKDHKCVERSLESNCPICNDFMFTSTTPVMFLPCGHCMHVSCYEEYTLTNYVCPICSKSLGDMELYFKRIDEVMETERMPDEYERYRSQVFCSDCERKSVTKFHFIYHKCQYDDCKSYNTKVVKTWELAEGEVEIPVVHDVNTPRAAPLNHFRDVETAGMEEEDETSMVTDSNDHEHDEDPQQDTEAIEAELVNFVMEE